MEITSLPSSSVNPAPLDPAHERILQSAGQLFLRRGLKSVSMDDIATALGVSKKTLYKSFETKEQLVLAVVTAHLSQAEGNCAQLAREAENAVHEIVLMMRWTKQEHSDTHPSIFYEMRKYFPAAFGEWQKHKLTFILGQVRGNLLRGIAEGLYRTEIDVEALARLHVAHIEGSFDPELFPAREFPFQRLAHVADEQFVRGLVTLAGLGLINRYFGTS